MITAKLPQIKNRIKTAARSRTECSDQAAFLSKFHCILIRMNYYIRVISRSVKSRYEPRTRSAVSSTSACESG